MKHCNRTLSIYFINCDGVLEPKGESKVLLLPITLDNILNKDVLLPHKGENAVKCLLHITLDVVLEFMIFSQSKELNKFIALKDVSFGCFVL